MDFIPLPDGVAAHEPVPDLGGPEYDNQGFQDYDRRQGWNMAALREGDVIRARDDWSEYSQIAAQFDGLKLRRRDRQQRVKCD